MATSSVGGRAPLDGGCRPRWVKDGNDGEAADGLAGDEEQKAWPAGRLAAAGGRPLGGEVGHAAPQPPAERGRQRGEIARAA